MTYYEKLVARMDEAAQKHPRSTIAMSAKDFHIIAQGVDPEKVSKKVNDRAKDDCAILFSGTGRNETWIL